MDREALFGSLYALTEKHSNWRLRLSRIPDSQCVSLPAGEFDPVRMTNMFNAGSAWVQKASPWETTIPLNQVANWPSGVAKPMEECIQPQNLLLPQCPM
jgi:hypothetical protein